MVDFQQLRHRFRMNVANKTAAGSSCRPGYCGCAQPSPWGQHPARPGLAYGSRQITSTACKLSRQDDQYNTIITVDCKIRDKDGEPRHVSRHTSDQTRISPMLATNSLHYDRCAS